MFALDSESIMKSCFVIMRTTLNFFAISVDVVNRVIAHRNVIIHRRFNEITAAHYCYIEVVQ